MNPIRLFPWFTMIFVVIMIAEFVGLTISPQVRLASKGLVMASLLGFYILNAKKQSHLMQLGMIFALLGDAFLLFTTDTFFFLGLGCFLVMQVSYSIFFLSKRRLPRSRDKVIAAAIMILPIMCLALTWDMLKGMRLPVAVYAIAIAAMLMTAYLRHPMLKGYLHVFVGAVLFVISDAVLGYTKFVSDLPHSGLIVMGTYMIAQYLIITGIIIDDLPRVKKKTVEPAIVGTFGRHKLKH